MLDGRHWNIILYNPYLLIILIRKVAGSEILWKRGETKDIFVSLKRPQYNMGVYLTGGDFHYFLTPS